MTVFESRVRLKHLKGRRKAARAELAIKAGGVLFFCVLSWGLACYLDRADSFASAQIRAAELAPQVLPAEVVLSCCACHGGGAQ